MSRSTGATCCVALLDHYQVYLRSPPHNLVTVPAYNAMQFQTSFQFLGAFFGNNQFAGKFNQLLGALSFLVSFSAEGSMLSGNLQPNMASLGL